MAFTPFKTLVRPTPEIPPLPPDTPKEVKQAVDALRSWCREVERAFRAVEARINGGTVELKSPDNNTWKASIDNAGAVSWAKE